MMITVEIKDNRMYKKTQSRISQEDEIISEIVKFVKEYPKVCKIWCKIRLYTDRTVFFEKWKKYLNNDFAIALNKVKKIEI